MMMMMMMMMMMATSYDQGATTRTGGIVQDVSPLFKELCNRDSDVLKFFMKGSVVRDKAYFWTQRSKVYTFGTLNAAITNVATSLVLNETTFRPLAIYPGRTVLSIGQENLLVTARGTVTATTVTYTVTRAYDGTTGAAATAGQSFQIIATDEAEGADATTDQSEYSYTDTGFTQIFRRELFKSGTEQALSVYGDINDLSREGKSKMEELHMEMQSAFLYGIGRNDSGTRKRRMRGLRDYALQVGNRIDAGGAALTETLLDARMQQFYKLSGKKNELMVIMSTEQQSRLNALKVAYVQNGGMDSMNTTVNRYIKKIDFGNGLSINAVICPSVNAEDMFVVNPSEVEVVSLQGRTFQKQPLAKTGDSDKILVVGEYGTKFYNPAGNLWHITNLAV
jgi:hypothetical protein